MKLTHILMFAVTLLCLRTHAETIVFVDGETNSIRVSANEAIFIDCLNSSDYGNNSRPLFRGEEQAGIVSITKGSAVAGPCELVFTNASVVTFHRIHSSTIETVLLGSNETNVVYVPTNKTLRIFPTDGESYAGHLVVQQGGRAYNVDMGAGDFEFSGPLAVLMVGKTPPYPSIAAWRQMFSYYITEDFVQMTAEGYLRGPSGTHEVIVEKSTDLKQWVPSMVQNTASSETKAFYRLRVQK